MYTAQNLSKRFKGLNLKFPDFQLQSGKAYWLKGASGTGKTTLLHLLAGLIRPDAGRLTFQEQDMGHWKPAQADKVRRRSIGMVFQQPYLHPALNCGENIQAACQFTGAAWPEELIDSLGIADLMKKKPQTISQGQAQRVAVIRALVHQPEVVLADEPTSALDPENYELVMKALLQRVEEGALLVLSSHDLRAKEQLNHVIELQPNPTNTL